MKKFLLISSISLFIGIISTSFLFSLHGITDIHSNLGILYLACCFLFVSVLLFLQQMHDHQEGQTNADKALVSSQMRLREQTHCFDAMFNESSTGMSIISLDGNILRANSAMLNLLGYSASEILSVNYFNLMQQNDNRSLQLNIQKIMEKKLNFFHAEQELLHKNSGGVWVDATLSLIRDDSDKPAFFIVQLQNIAFQKQTEERLRHMAYHDPLTDLANRNKLEQFIQHLLANSRRHHESFALLFIDLDRFKNINDTEGHPAGDILLQVVAERLRNSVRNNDMVARLGGDEFVVVVTDVKREEAVAVIAQKILDYILQVIVISGRENYITASIGISLYPTDGQSMQNLMKNADLALHRAKDEGRNNYQFYTTELTQRAHQKLALQNAIGHALIKDEFELHYQPKMNIATGRITGVEALLRWKNKEYGMITPNEIISLAEETGLIIPVSSWIMQKACAQLAQWHKMGFTFLTVSVNCTSRQFKQATFVDEIINTLNECGLSPQALELEITESIIMQDPESSLRILYVLKGLGVRIVIDNFGTGYWSLNNIRRLSVDKIKIDKSFIAQILHDVNVTLVVSAIISMINKLGATSIAEGVETREQFEYLTKEDCKEIQGYYLSRPLPADRLISFLKDPHPIGEQTEV